MNNSRPEAFITKGKQRLKQNGNIVYLNNNDEFEVELFNPTTKHILAKILLDNKPISNSGIILKPGQRIFLERYLDSNNKFLFTTYDVDGSNRQVLNAISNNGVVRIEFYNEMVITTWSSAGTISWGSITDNNYNPTVTIAQPQFYTPTIYTSNPTVYTMNSGNPTMLCDNLAYSSTTSNNVNVNQAKVSHSKKIETGTIEKGGKSNQQLSFSDMQFGTIANYITTWKILPMSRKQYTADELPAVYCTNCGSKRKKDTHKFCPNCGNRF